MKAEVRERMIIKQNSKYTLFWLLTVLLGSVLFLPWILAPGMASDGMAYATIGRNLAEGRGTFWQPFFSQTLFPAFYEHPPIVFAIESLFYRILGDYLFVDKLYTFTCFILSGFLLVKIWQLVTGDSVNAWLPLILWVAVPEVSYAYANNFLENTMGVFCFGSCYSLLYYFRNGNHKKWLILISVLLIMLGTLSKGPFALFPIALPGIYWVAFRKISFAEALKCTILLVIGTLLCFSLLMLWPAARQNLLTYFSSQVIESIAGHRSLPGNRFFVLNTLIYKLKPIYLSIPFVFLAGVVFVKTKVAGQNYRAALFFFLMALAITLPVLISPKQFEQYILCAYAFYALAGAALVSPFVDYWIKRFINPKRIVSGILNLTLVLAIISSVYFGYKHPEDYIIDRDILKDVQNMQPHLLQNSVLYVGKNCDNEWPLRAVMYRRYHISIADESSGEEYFLASGSNPPVPEGYKQLSLGNKYCLFVRQN